MRLLTLWQSGQTATFALARRRNTALRKRKQKALRALSNERKLGVSSSIGEYLYKDYWSQSR